MINGNFGENNINKNEFKKVLSEKVKEYREETQENIAEKSQISIDTLSLLERKGTIISSYNLVKLTNALNTTPNHLLKDFITNKKMLYDELLSYELDTLTDDEKEFLLYTVKFIKQNKQARK